VFSFVDGILLCRSSSDLTFTLACRPSPNGVASLMSELLTPPSKPEMGLNAVLIYSGLIAEGSGHWLLPNYLFTPALFADNLEKLISACPKPVDAENQPQYKRVHIHIGFVGSSSGGDWRQLSTYHFDPLGGHPIQISVNQLSSRQKPVAADCAPDLSALNSWLQSLFAELPATYCTPLTHPLNCRDPGGPTLRVARPCLYVFPEGSGQSAILTLPGYSMLVDTGCTHRPCFWPVANHLDRLDSVFLTHWGVNNLLGMCAVLPVAFAPASSKTDSQDPVLCLLTPPPNPAQIYTFPELSSTRSSLILSLPRQVSKLVNQIKQSGANLVVQPLTRGAKLSAPTQPIQLYQKVGQGSLELYALTPGDDESAELRRLNDDWAKASPSLMTTPVTLCKSTPANKFSVPLLSHTSVSALAVWRPARDIEPILRILFISPIVHQTRVLLSLEAVVASNIYLRHAKAVPAEYERKRPVNPVSRRSNMPSTIGAKAPSVSSVASSGVKPPAKRLTTVPAAHSAAVKHNEKSRPSTKAMPSKTGLINSSKSETPDSAAKTLLERVAPVVPMDHQELDLMHTNGDQNGYHSNPSAEFEPQPVLSANMARLDLDAEAHKDGLILDDSTNHVQPEFPASTGLVDPITSWGDPQELPPPAPPIGSLSNSKAVPESRQAPAKRLTSASSQRSTGFARTRKLSISDPAHFLTTFTGLQLFQLNYSVHCSPTARSNGSLSSAATAVTYAPGYTDASAHALGPGSTKLPPYDKVKPMYVDIAFLPGGGNPHLVDAEWFKRVRARYYVATDPRPSAVLMEAMVVGRESWTGEDANLPASLILAHESEELMIWLGRNSGRLAACHLDVSAIASRSSIQLMSESQLAAEATQSLTCTGYRIDL
ncbi:hypothetical protein EG68_07554, partial [Paragonimus skrjabini miyazakii]